METATILELVKARIGISTQVRDEYLKAIIAGVLDELELEKGIKLDKDDNRQLMFIVNYTTWKYENRDSGDAMPRYLQWDLNNLYLSGDKDV